MRNVATLFVLLLSPLFIFAANNTTSTTIFHQGDLEKVKAKASEEGKLFFVDFYADYCYACKLMDETTFVDPSLASYVDDTYIPYKVDVLVDFDGISMKDEYNVNVLPTILVFNSKGELVGRYEAMLGPTRMLKELKKYDIPENRIKAENPVEEIVVATPTNVYSPATKPTVNYEKLTSNIENTAPGKPTFDNDNRIGHAINTNKENITASKEEAIEDTNFGFAKKEKPTTSNSERTIPKKKKIKISQQESLPVETETTTAPEPVTDEANPTEGLFKFTVEPHENQGYGVQIGVFAQYGNVLREVQKLQSKFNTQPILVNISNLNGVVVYKVIVGSFDSNNEAVAFRRTMQRKGADGFIKDLSTIKI